MHCSLLVLDIIRIGVP